MFAGLMSRCTMPSACAASSASAISIASDKQQLQSPRTARDPVLQRLPVQELHGDERLALLLADVVNGADVGMVQRGSRLSFAPESLQSLADLCATSSGRNFRATKRSQARVFGLVDHTHPAAAQLLDNAVVRDGLADHWRRILRLWNAGKSMKAVELAVPQKACWRRISVSPAILNWCNRLP